jgi:hypothetical protein
LTVAINQSHALQNGDELGIGAVRIAYRDNPHLRAGVNRWDQE